MTVMTIIMQTWRPSISHLSLFQTSSHPIFLWRGGGGKVLVLSKADCRYKGREIDLGRSHTFEEIDHETISTAILLDHPLIQGELLGSSLTGPICYQKTEESTDVNCCEKEENG